MYFFEAHHRGEEVRDIDGPSPDLRNTDSGLGGVKQTPRFNILWPISNPTEGKVYDIFIYDGKDG